MIQDDTAKPARDSRADNAALLHELEQSTQDAVTRNRAHVRLNIRAQVVVQRADQSRRRESQLQGVTGDLSSGGCLLLLSAPLDVGDFYLVTFDRKALDLPPAFARCLRARLMRDDAYEVGLSFLSPVDLSSAVRSAETNSLI